MLGAGTFGVLEFANSALMYFLLIADGGLEMWGTREAARDDDVHTLVSRILPLRLLLAAGSFAVLLALLPVFPVYPQLRIVILLFGLSLFPQAISLKWLLLGKERMSRVAGGLVIGQLLFAAGIVAFVHHPRALLWVPILRFVGDIATAAYFAIVFFRSHGKLQLKPTLRGAKDFLRPALAIGTSQAMGLLTYNLDSILLGFLTTATVVGWYSAAYKPVTIALTVAMTYFTAVFPAMSRSYSTDRTEFRELMAQSVRLCTVLAVPMVAGATFLAVPVITLLYGPAYANSARPFQILVWSAALAIIRCNYSNALRGTGFQKLDLRCAITAAAANVVLNLLLIPHFGMIGAAAATVVADVIWLATSYRYFRRELVPDGFVSVLARPLIAGALMATFLWLALPLVWPARAVLGLLLYFVALLALGEPALRGWLTPSKGQDANSAAAGTRARFG